jgi:hypothetical protein
MPDEGKAPTSPLRLLAEQERRELGGDHPEAEQLAAYHGGRLSEPEEERVREHLALCAPCTRQLLDLAAFHDEMSAQAASGGAALGAAPPGSWQSLRARLEADGAAPLEAFPAGAPPGVAPAPARPPGAGRHPGRGRRGWTVLALAAGVAALAVGLALRQGGLLFPRGGLGSPGEGLVAVTVPEGAITRGPGEGGAIEVSLGRGITALVLPIRAARAFPAYRIEVYARGGMLSLAARAEPTRIEGFNRGGASSPTAKAPPTPVEAVPGAVSSGAPGAPSSSRAGAPSSSPAGAPQVLLLPLTGGQLAPGEYQIQVMGVEVDGREERVASFGLTVH